MTPTLYKIREEHMELLQLIEQNDGELTPELEQALSLTQEEFQAKAVSYGYVIKHFEDDTSLIDAEIKRLQELKARAELNMDYLKQRLSSAMQEFGIEKIKTATLSLSFRTTEAVEITNQMDIPMNYLDSKVVATISKTRIKEALKAGADVPGARLLTNKHLQIK